MIGGKTTYSVPRSTLFCEHWFGHKKLRKSRTDGIISKMLIYVHASMKGSITQYSLIDRCINVEVISISEGLVVNSHWITATPR